MNKEDWDELLAHTTKVIIKNADEEVEGEFPTPQEILNKLSEFRAAIRDSDSYLADVKSALIDYTSHSVRKKNNIN